jgi:hypothetical protein
MHVIFIGEKIGEICYNDIKRVEIVRKAFLEQPKLPIVADVIVSYFQHKYYLNDTCLNDKKMQFVYKNYFPLGICHNFKIKK